ncbi:dienelactone hydrolase family protein [Streptomyces roseoverticillatus]|uniref:dienelactone hydrolase family protein n=1 Tax=Streptomyces roseoverticillatus TaxID=66429 RepID=UPI001F3C7446|nr:dienelactone hydrolase family protein [Streptomyces roseoverticillatus]MCF3102227.1 dienelactone hydrolase family protein [Streptomyces roseoverticillatus]
MRFTSQASSDGVTEQLFTLPFASGEIPGVLWTPDGATGPRPLILMGHGGGQHKKAPGVVHRAHRFVAEAGFAVAAIDAPAHNDRPKTAEQDRLITEMRAGMQARQDVSALLAEVHALIAAQSVPEWQAVLDALTELDHVGAGPVGYWGMSLGCGLGVPLVAAEPRIRAAVLGLNGEHQTSTEAAAQITVPVEFLVQWDDERVPRAAALALFDLFASPEKTLHANPGGHGEVPAFETDSSLRFFTRHLS